MITKLVEIVDRMTCIPAIAIQVSYADGPLARHAGYGEPCVLLGSLHGKAFHYDPFAWGDRTWTTAHVWLRDNFDSIADHAVIDVEFILGETKQPKTSQVRR